jgi:hypothetical protein
VSPAYSPAVTRSGNFVAASGNISAALNCDCRSAVGSAIADGPVPNAPRSGNISAALNCGRRSAVGSATADGPVPNAPRSGNISAALNCDRRSAVGSATADRPALVRPQVITYRHEVRCARQLIAGLRPSSSNSAVGRGYLTPSVAGPQVSPRSPDGPNNPPTSQSRFRHWPGHSSGFAFRI